jgi:hypothetical protein
MPGDEFVPHSKLGCTRAITIDAPVDVVWSGLVHMGRTGSGGNPDDGAESVAGDLIQLGPAGYPCFRVRRVVAPTEFLLLSADPKAPHASLTPDGATGAATWQWLLHRLDGGRRTRLLTRQRLSYPRRLSVIRHVVEPVGFVVERRMLRAIKRRAEAG